MTLNPDRRRLLYRAMHRGFKEADIIVGKFATDNLAHMTPQEIDEFKALLEVPDQDLYAWIIGRAEVPDNYDGPVFRQMKEFNVAAQLLSS